ncbi:hypothetical protein [Streptomyces sp. CA-111067]|uniref:hypothetical protein n=1 Tax=Streptomyces sp. CA-111067 TaxID=3240046 RepID=UPI003D98F46D
MESTAMRPGARATAAVICCALIAVELAWMIRDINADGLHDAVWMWIGLQLAGQKHPPPFTGIADVVVIVTAAGALFTSRRPAAVWGFVTAGIIAFVMRLPGVWMYANDWLDGAPLHTRALLTSVGGTLAGLVLLGLGLWGREQMSALARSLAPRDQPSTPAGAGAVPRPSRGTAAAAGALLVVLALEMIGWQIFYVHKYADGHFQPHFYKYLLIGEMFPSVLLGPPTLYLAWALVALALGAAVAAFARHPLARPLGLSFVLSLVLARILLFDTLHSEHLLFRFDRVETYVKADQIFAVAEVLLAVLIGLLLLVKEDPARALPQGWGPPAPQYGAPAGWGPMPQQPPAAGGFGPPPPNHPPQ